MSDAAKYSSKRPYVFRAYFDWLLENELTPFVAIDARQTDVSVPESAINVDNEVVLNLSPNAIRDYSCDLNGVGFKARFNGKSESIYFPFAALICIYAREDVSQMLMFPNEALCGFAEFYNGVPENLEETLEELEGLVNEFGIDKISSDDFKLEGLLPEDWEVAANELKKKKPAVDNKNKKKSGSSKKGKPALTIVK